MNAGEGPFSYARNSTVQGTFADSAKQIIEEKISTELDIKQIISTSTNGILFIADFGCGTGSNSIAAVKVITEAITRKKEAEGLLLPSDFLVFFNDVYANDFNTLFGTLPSERKYYASGLPGDFHQRLLPKSSLTFGYSSIALHWLTRVPKGLTDQTSPAWNKGAIYCTMDNNQVHNAYLDQFAKDFESFLQARAEELVCGGMLALIIPVAISNNLPSYIHLLNSSLIDMVNKGRLSQDQLTSFNLPYYFATLQELRAIILRFGGSFMIEKLEILTVQQNTSLPVDAFAGVIRSTHERFLKDHFGSEVMDELFDTFIKKEPYVDDSVKAAIIILKCDKNY